MKVAVLTGGLSDERDVSLASGDAISRALRVRGHRVAVVDAADVSAGHALRFTSASTLPVPRIAVSPPSSRTLESLRRKTRGNVFGDRVRRTLCAADVVFIALHGGFGEDGHVQAALEMLGCPHTGANYRACALAFHKPTAKLMLTAAGISTAAWEVVGPGEAALGSRRFPLVVKPVSGGSTIGVSVCQTTDELLSAIERARRYEEEVMIEAFIKGREFTVGILNGEPLGVVEIRVGGDGLFDYRAKYQSGGAEELAPAPISRRDTTRLQKIARAVHHALGLGLAYSRVDIRGLEQPQVLELNPLPGMTPMSLLPKSASAASMDYPTLCDRIALRGSA